MTRDVLITISGIRVMAGENEDIEVITPGYYTFEEGIHKIVYDEPVEGVDKITKNTISISDVSMDIIKEGIANATLCFGVELKKSIMSYNTPFGDIMFGIKTNNMIVDETQDRLKVSVDYSMFMEDELLSNCSMIVDICSKSVAKVDLHTIKN